MLLKLGLVFMPVFKIFFKIIGLTFLFFCIVVFPLHENLDIKSLEKNPIIHSHNIKFSTEKMGKLKLATPTLFVKKFLHDFLYGIVLQNIFFFVASFSRMNLFPSIILLL